MKFCWTTLYVRDMKESLQFYKEIAGLTLVRKTTPSPEMEFAFLGSGETQVELIRDSNKTDMQYSDCISMGFQTDSLDTFTDFLSRKNIPIHSGPFQPNPSVRFLFVTDPNGMKIQFVEFLK